MILAQVTFSDWQRFHEQFTTTGAELRRRHGSRGVRVLRAAGEEGVAFLLFAWDAEAFDRFRADPEVQASMQAGGAAGPPIVHAVEPVDQLPV